MEHALTADQKKGVLNNIQRIPVEDLIEYIKTGQISFQEMRETQKLSRDKQDEINKILLAVEEKKRIEKDFWTKTQTDDTIRAYENFLRAYPESAYTELAESQLEGLRSLLVEKKKRILNEIERNPDNYTRKSIQEKIDSGEITKNELVEHGIITEQALRQFLNPPQFFMPQHEWRDLPPLPEGNTDVYFFGIPRSGKSCVLSGILSMAEELGMLRENIRNKKGVEYLNELKRCVDIGYVPESTSTDTVNYISFSLKDNANNREHDLSIIEMSGEYFKQTYEKDTTGSEGIGAQGFLSNDNRKVIFLVMDYYMHGMGPEANERATQSDLFRFCLLKLAEDGTLKKTDALHLIVTKSDLMPEGVDIKEYTATFLKEQYPSLVNLIKDLNKKYGINASRDYQLVYHPFSLGKFMLGKTFLFNRSDSENLLLDLMSSTRHKRKKKFYNKLFGG